MGKSKHFRYKLHKPSPNPNKPILLETTSLKEIELLKEFGEYYINFHWDFYSSLSFERSKISTEIRKAILGAAVSNYDFSKWKRIVKLKYGNQPLSVKGSLKTIGGRYNIGDLGSPLVTSFPALYIAEDFDTGIKEVLCDAQDEQAYVLALANKTSFSSVSLKGYLDFVIDLNQPERLQAFVDLIKDFAVPDYIEKAAKKINEKIDLIKTVPGLMNALLISNWRDWPMLFDVPVASQIFGQLVADAGIEGILYPSKHTHKNCLAVFPQNFDSVDSYIELEDESPAEVKIRRLDMNTWKQFQRDLMGV